MKIKIPFNFTLGVVTEVLYAAALISAAFLISLFISQI